MPDVDLIGYLTEKGVQTYRSNGSEVSAHCIFGCTGSATHGKGKLYLNTETWLYTCMVCGASGNRKTLLKHFGDEDEQQHPQATDPILRRRILSEAADIAHEMLISNESQLNYLLNRGISGEQIVTHRLGYAPRNVGLSDMLPVRPELKGYEALIAAGLVTVGGREWLNGSLVIPYMSHHSVVQLRAKFVDGKYLTNAGDRVRLFNADSLFGADEVLITEGELDALAVLSAMEVAPDRVFEGLAVVGLPGAGSWPDDLFESLAGVSKVYVGLDPDETGKKFAAKLMAELGSRARMVHLPEGEPKTDWSDWFSAKTPRNPRGGHTWRDLKDLLTESDLAGKHMFTVRDLAAKWTQRKDETPGLRLGWPSIDSIIRPGLKPGQVFVPLAATGTGKSVLLHNLIHNMRAKRGLYLSLEMTGPEVWEHLRRIHRFHFQNADRDQVFDDYQNLRVTELNRINRSGLSQLIHEYQDEMGHTPDFVLVDYLQYLARAFRGGSPYERVTDAIMESKAVAKEETTALIIPSQVNRGAERGKPLTMDVARGAGEIEETADFVMGMFRPDQLPQPNGEALPETGAFALQLLKSRHGGTGKTFPLKLSPLSLVLVDAVFDHKNVTRVEQELSLHRQGIHYEDYRKMLDEQHSQGALL